MRLSTILEENGVGGTTSRAQNMLRVVNKHSLNEGITTRKETNSLEH